MALIPTIPGLATRPVRDAAELLAVRRLHAECYVDAGYVSADDLDSRGLIDDPWVPYSDYFAAVDTEEDTVVGTCRIIRPSVRGFPAFEQPIYPEALDVFADLDPNQCLEVSALATSREGLQNMAVSAALYGLVWRQSINQRRAYMLALMDDRLLRIMRRWFVAPFEAIGESSFYMGSSSTPVAMYIPRAYDVLRERTPDSLRFFSGDISFSELAEVAVDLRTRVPEHRTNLVDLTAERAPAL